MAVISCDELRARIGKVPRVSLGHLPTAARVLRAVD